VAEQNPGAVGMDANPRAHADVIHDLGTLPYPFPNDEFDEVVCSHVAEHVPDVMAFVTELFRITRPGGRIKITTPHYSNPDWPTDPTHRNHFTAIPQLLRRRAPGLSFLYRGQAEADPHLCLIGESLACHGTGADSESRSALARSSIHA